MTLNCLLKALSFYSGSSHLNGVFISDILDMLEEKHD